MNTKSLKNPVLVLALVAAGLYGCSNDNGPNNANLSAAPMVLLSSDNRLIGLNPADASLLGESTLRGFQTSGETAVGIDYRPFNGALYVITKDGANAGRAYTANLANGQLTFIAQLQADPTDAITSSPPYATMSGTQFGVDFNPAADALRVISNTGQNLRIFLDSDRRGKTPGFTFTDGDLNAGTAAAGFSTTGAAYTNSFDGTSTTRLFDLDVANDRLLLADANAGTLTDAGPLGVDAGEASAFDIDPETNLGYAILNVGGTTSLYTLRIPGTDETLPVASVNTSKVGDLAFSGSIVGLAQRPNQNPIAVALSGTPTNPTLFSFSPRSPNTILANNAVTGLGAGDELLSIDYRPATGELFGLVRNGTAGRLVTIDGNSVATTLAPLVDQSAPGTPIVLDPALSYNIDFNPAADALRIVTSSAGGLGGNGTNLRVIVRNVGTNQPGYTIIEANQTGGNLSAGTGTAANFDVTQIAYSDNYSSTVRPSPATKLFDIDRANNQLLQQDSANSGNLNLVNSLGISPDNYGGFDIAGGDNGARLVAARLGGNLAYSLFNLSLSSGATGSATAAGSLTSGDTLIGGAAGPVVRDLTIRFHGLKQ